MYKKITTISVTSQNISTKLRKMPAYKNKPNIVKFTQNICTKLRSLQQKKIHNVAGLNLQDAEVESLRVWLHPCHVGTAC